MGYPLLSFPPSFSQGRYSIEANKRRATVETDARHALTHLVLGYSVQGCDPFFTPPPYQGHTLVGHAASTPATRFRGLWTSRNGFGRVVRFVEW